MNRIMFNFSLMYRLSICCKFDKIKKKNQRMLILYSEFYCEFSLYRKLLYVLSVKILQNTVRNYKLVTLNYCGETRFSPWSKHGLKLGVCTADQAQTGYRVHYTLYLPEYPIYFQHSQI